MADFCTKCAIENFGEEERSFIKEDIDVQKIFESLKIGYSSSGHLCEGCGLISIANIDGKLQVMRIPIDETEEKLSTWEDY